MYQTKKNFVKFAILLWTLQLLFIPSANGDGTCTKLKYGTPEENYMPVLEKYCAHGYQGVNGENCRPICDNGCPENSQCIIPGICGCDPGYEIDVKYDYFGTTAIFSFFFLKTTKVDQTGSAFRRRSTAVELLNKP